MEFSDIYKLETDGVAVINLSQCNISDDKTVSNILSEQQEFYNTSDQLSAGGFGAFGNPSSFHSPTIRKLRSDLARVLLDNPGGLRAFYSQYHSKKVCMLIDRFCLRYAGTRTSAESWHRDTSPIKPGEIVYGGWYNLSQYNQYFSCVLGTQRSDSYLSEPGFNKIDSAQYKSQKSTITIPPRHYIIFNQDIVHEVKPQLAHFDSAKLFSGFYITSDSETLFGNQYLNTVLSTQSVPYLPSSQLVPMYPKLWAVNWKSKLQKYSLNIKTPFLNKDGIVQRFAPSLKVASELDTSIYMFDSYSDSEIDILIPK